MIVQQLNISTTIQKQNSASTELREVWGFHTSKHKLRILMNLVSFFQGSTLISILSTKSAQKNYNLKTTGYNRQVLGG